MDKRYEILPHTADGKFRAYGRTLEEAFANAGLAMVSFMWEWERIKPRLLRSFDLGGRDREQLLVRFLNEIIYLAESEGFLVCSFEGLRIESGPDGLRLGARLRGDLRSAGYEVFGEVKAATYNEMSIEEDGGFSVQTVVDL